MNARFARLAKLAASGIFFASLLSVGTGCGAIKAATNPKSAWALSDPAPMAVVVRRADAAEGTAKEVDRLLTSTPAAPDAPWVVATAPTDEEQKKDGDAIANHTLYVQSQARIVSAELWARSLPTRKDGKGDAKADGKIVKADKPAKKKGRKTESKAEAKTAEADAGKKTDVGTTTLTGAEVPAANSAARADSLIAAIDPALAATYAVVMAKKKEVADLRTFQPGLTLDGTNVQVTLNGLTPEDMGKLKVGEVTKEVADREQKWVKHAVMLMGAISSNKEILGFEEDVLVALLDGFTAGGWKAPAAPILKEPPPGKPQPQGAPVRTAAKS